MAADVCINGESLPDEVARLDAAGLLPPGSQCAEALGYKQVLAAIAPERHPRAADPLIKNLDDAFERTKILTRRFAKQQRTWLKRFRGVRWIEMPCEDALEEVGKAGGIGAEDVEIYFQCRRAMTFGRIGRTHDSVADALGPHATPMLGRSLALPKKDPATRVFQNVPSIRRAGRSNEPAP